LHYSFAIWGKVIDKLGLVNVILYKNIRNDVVSDVFVSCDLLRLSLEHDNDIECKEE